MIDLRSTIESFAQDVVIRRRAPGILSDGIFVNGAETAVTVRASVQPTGRKSWVLPPGIRVEDTLTLYCTTALLDGDDSGQTLADRFTYGRYEYEIQSVKDWAIGGQGLYYKALALRVRDRQQDNT